MENEYLAILYEYLENGLNRVTTTELASKMYVTLGAVSSLLKKLWQKESEGVKLINYMKGYGTSLTDKGQEVAGQIIRRRRISEIFLKNLGFNFYSVQKQVYQVNLTNEVADRIEEQLIEDKNEIRCSHGYLVPEKSGSYKFEQLPSIDKLDCGSKVKIVRIPESPFFFIPQYNPSETDYFLKIYNNNLVPETTVSIISKEPESILIETELGRENIPVRAMASQIYVEKI
jgi:DtxR family Mn-dependent transcriptional regulator